MTSSIKIQPGLSERVVFLSATPTSAKRSGGELSPLDASTPQKLNAIYKRYPDNVAFIYKPGNFRTQGWQYRSRPTIGTNMSHIGYRGQSVLTLVDSTKPSSTGNGVIFGSDFNQEVQNLHIRGLTLDVNANQQPGFAQGKGAFIAIRAYGDKVHVEGCEVVGFGTSSGAECFPVIVGRTRNPKETTRMGANTVQDCLFHKPATNNKGPLTCVLMGATGTGKRLGFDAGLDVVRDCKFHDITRAKTRFTVCHGVTAPILEGCTFDGIDDPYYVEAQGEPSMPVAVDYGNLVVRNNVFRNYRYGVTLRQSTPKTPTKLLQVTGNTFLSRKAAAYRKVSALCLLTAIRGSNANALRLLAVDNNTITHIDGSYGGKSKAHFAWVVSEGKKGAKGDQLAHRISARNNLVQLMPSKHLTLNDLPRPHKSVGSESVFGNDSPDPETVNQHLSFMGF